MIADDHRRILVAFLAVGAVGLVATASPVHARAPKTPRCDDRFAIDGPAPLLPGSQPSAAEVIVLQPKTMIMGPDCRASSAQIRRTRTGWRIRAKWKGTCGGLTKARFEGAVDGQCTTLTGLMRAKGHVPTDVTAYKSICGDRKIDPGRGEVCDPDDGVGCVDDCKRALTIGTTTTTVAAASTTTVTVASTTSTTIPVDCGNGHQDVGEQCDGSDLGGARCPDDPVGGAYVTCAPNCRLDWSHCPSCAGAGFGGTWEAIQNTIFTRHDCRNDACHGAATQGGLDLRASEAYAHLVEMPSMGQPEFNRVEPGDERRSYLWLKLALKTDLNLIPDDVSVFGNPMPSVGAALDADELEALRLWIYAGAPEAGSVRGTEKLLNACLPPARPLTITPLPPPAPEDGVQLTMPPWPLEHDSEHEICFGTYFDLRDQVPAEFQQGGDFVFSSQEMRQDPQSHHLIVNIVRTNGADDATVVQNAAWGGWTCLGGARAGTTCNPLDRASCGSDGWCTSRVQPSFACIGYGPYGGGLPDSIGGAQKSQSFESYPDGVYAHIPMKGFLLWNSHAFNLTEEDTTMHAWLNYYYAKSQTLPLQSIFDISHIFDPYAAPFTKQTTCGIYYMYQGARLFSLSSHTHRHGERFWVTRADGTVIYENFVYNDPPIKRFNPPIQFTRSEPLTYCATYNNGVKSDGTPDIELVTRHSRVPPQGTQCQPTACVAGKVGAPCAGNDRACDSSPGAGDGWCDACPITGGESTENEMFILIGSFYYQ